MKRIFKNKNLEDIFHNPYMPTNKINPKIEKASVIWGYSRK